MKKTKLQKLLQMMMKMQNKKTTRNILSKIIRELINWSNQSGKTDDELFDLAIIFLSLPSNERINELTKWKKGKKLRYKIIANTKGKKILIDNELINDIISVINDLKGWWREAPENGEIDFFTRFLNCINTEDNCDLREQVKKSVKKSTLRKDR